ncbi:Protein TusC like protein [Saliniradius amylolyticus]|uniref:Protein TusC like protein n=1 Tax=Saliniradius amylolyticus TaxID=2183582 RepID=A0A2S2E2X9_9ALTE|nr:sulfurtransferase complex subunit TusC [Saliniradius amylolyticus]AWL12001.1 Protein TusC like protein [Saliniradius amylolyticus]
MTQVAVISRRAPYAGHCAQEALDLAMMAGTFGLECALFVAGDGVFQLVKHQQPEPLQRKNFSKTFAALEFYDVEPIYVLESSLSERGINPQDLLPEVSILSPELWQQTLAGYQHLVSL